MRNCYLKNFGTVAALLYILLGTACMEEPLPTTGQVFVTIETRNNFANYDVASAIVLSQTDQQGLVEFPLSDISSQGRVEFDSVRLNLGNYYLRYQFFLNNNPFGSLQHKPFQLQLGENLSLDILDE